ncbi:hypothetical protein [Jiella sonneratiae]|uniref:SMI1/KNR4 family protein n=1 Tax=Jiella sonneratiae TaxID=2816856 RepID=A0ABS3J9G0_9HYPH|nr:hypothetical protein [Jiella sonneratiae]MBO0906313.1 hypothetical protein [Jiella sonneratiae]
MVEEIVTPERLEAGERYLGSLRALGFEPDGALWSMRPSDPSSLELSIFSSLVEKVGPLTIYRALFDAYDQGKTPADFDPWIVSLYGPHQTFFDAVAGFDAASVDPDKGAAFVMCGGSDHEEGGNVVRTTDFEIVRIVHREWVYKVLEQPRASPAASSLRRWRRFEENLARAA